MTKPNPSYATESGLGHSDYHAVFINTNLDTHFVLIVSDTETVSDLKNKIVQEHPVLFPNYGEIRVNSVKVKRRGEFYCLCDSIPVSTAFIGMRKSWFLSVEASSNMEIHRNHNALKSNFEDQLTRLAMCSNLPNDKGDLKIVCHQRSATDYEVPSTSQHSKHIDAITNKVSPSAIGKEGDHLEQGVGIAREVNAIGSSSMVKETNHLEEGAELSKQENDVVIGAPALEADGMDINEISHENIYKPVAREHAGEETDATGAEEHKRTRKRKKSAKTVNAVNQKPFISDIETVEGFDGGFSKNELQKDIDGIQAGDKCEIGDKHASQDGAQEKHIVAVQTISGVEHVNGIGLMDGVGKKEASHNKKDYVKKKSKKRRISEEKNLPNTETNSSDPTSKDLLHADGTGLLYHIKEKEVADNKEREGSEKCEVGNNNASQGQEEEIVAAHVKSGVQDVKEAGLLDSIEENEASNNIQDHTKKKTKKKRSRKETLMNTELNNPDFARKNLLIAEDLTANQVGDKCERGGDNVSPEGGKETVVAAPVKSSQERGSLNHEKEKKVSVIQEDHAKKKSKKRRSREEKNLLNTEEMSVNAADGKSGNDHGQVPESEDQIEETIENKVNTDDSRDKKKKKPSRNSKKKELLHAETSHPDASFGLPLHPRNDRSTLDSSVMMAKEGKAGTATPMSSSVDPGLKIEGASIDIDRAHIKANVVSAVSSIMPSPKGNKDGSRHTVVNSDAPSGDLKKKRAGHHADVLGESDEINFRDYFVSAHPEHGVVPPGNLIVAGEIRDDGVNNKLKIKACRNKPDANANVTSSDLSNSVMSGQPKRKAEVNGSETSAASLLDLKVSQNSKRGKKDCSEVDRYRFTARKSSDGNNGKTITRLECKKSLLDTSNAIFKEDSTGSSEDPHGAEDSNASTRTPSDNMLSDYSDADSLQDENTSKRDAGGNNIKKSHLTMEAIIRSSNRYKKAKLAASQSRTDEMVSEPVDFVPDSQANI